MLITKIHQSVAFCFWFCVWCFCLAMIIANIFAHIFRHELVVIVAIHDYPSTTDITMGDMKLNGTNHNETQQTRTMRIGHNMYCMSSAHISYEAYFVQQLEHTALLCFQYLRLCMLLTSYPIFYDALSGKHVWNASFRVCDRVFARASIHYMITSSNRNFFRVTGPLCGEFTGHRRIPLKGQWRGVLMFSLICAWINRLVNNREAGYLRRHHAHHNVIVMKNLSRSDDGLKFIMGIPIILKSTNAFVHIVKE